MTERQAYLDLLGGGADRASGRRMVFGRLPVRPREADFMAAVADLASDNVAFVGTRADLAQAMDVSTKSIDRYAAAVSVAGYLAKSRVGNRCRFELLIGAIIDGPKTMDTPVSIAPKRSTVDSARHRSTSTVVETRQQLASRLVRTCGEVVLLIVAVVCYSRYVRRTQKPVNAVRIGDAWQGLLFVADPPPAPKPVVVAASKPATATMDTKRKTMDSPHDHEMKNEMIHEACALGSVKSNTNCWPFEVTKAALTDPVRVAELYRHGCLRDWFQDTEATRLGFEAVAVQVANARRVQHYGRLLTSMVKQKKWAVPSDQGGVTQKSEQAAAARRKPGQIRPTVALPMFRDPDAAIAANRDDQVKRMTERMAARNAELVAG